MELRKLLTMTAASVALAAPALADDVKVSAILSTTGTYAFVGVPLGIGRSGYQDMDSPARLSGENVPS